MEADGKASRKPILTVEEQIAHLKAKGVKFVLCDEAEAVRYLAEKCNFFKLASYRKLFAKREGGDRDGQYVDLDFAQLRLLASLDQQLRFVLLGMTLDIEHFQKVAVLHEMDARGEDGYAIVADYMASLSQPNRDYRLHELKMSGYSPYSAGVYAKYADDMPAWVFFELTSFGTLIDFVRFCARRWNDRSLHVAHYDLKGVKSLELRSSWVVYRQRFRRPWSGKDCGHQFRRARCLCCECFESHSSQVDGVCSHAADCDGIRRLFTARARGTLPQACDGGSRVPVCKGGGQCFHSAFAGTGLHGMGGVPFHALIDKGAGIAIIVADVKTFGF